MRMTWAVALASVWMAGGCEHGSGVVRPAPGVQVVEGADGSSVALLNAEPERAFTVVGRVRASADARIEARIGEARGAAERALRDQGAAVGADAVIVDEAAVLDLDGGAVAEPMGDTAGDRQRPGGSVYATRPVHRVVLVGRAVRWE